MSPQSQIAHYRITSKLGEGGMGAVYRATDTKLNRDVAIKVLPDSFANDPDRLARFTREAQVLASLNHPNIAAIYGVEERALVLELVEGPTLAERIAQGLIPVDEALPIARQIAEALEYAHERAIVHRDLKPANVKVTPEGRVKVLDFGLAKALSAEPSQAEACATVTMRSTAMGMIMGTAGYMSPEQAKGKPVDRRADIWAFGVLLIEMLTGRQLYTGETVSELLASVIKDQPDIDRLPATTPSAIRRLARRCLDKDPLRRLQAIGEARIAIDEALAGPPDEAPAPAPLPGRPSRLPWVAACIFACLALAAGGAWLLRPVEQPAHLNLSVLPPANATFAPYPPLLSPDGRRLLLTTVVHGNAQLWVRDLDLAEPRLLPGTDGAEFPFWAPNSRFAGFFADGKLKKIDVTGGPAQTLCSVPNSRGGSWGRSDVIIFTPNPTTSLMRVPAGGGSPSPATELDSAGGELSHRLPSFLPDGRHFLFLVRHTNPQKMGIYVGDLESKERRQVEIGPSNGMYVPPGLLLFVRERSLMVRPFDLTRLQATGDATPAVDHVDFQVASSLGMFSASQTGTLAYYTGGVTDVFQLTWFDRAGKPLGTVGPPDTMLSVSISPDGGTVAADRQDRQNGSFDIWLHDLAHHTDFRLTTDPAQDFFPVWSPDGSRVGFSSTRDGQTRPYQMPANGSGKAELLLPSNLGLRLADWSRDSRYTVFDTPNFDEGVWGLSMAGAGAPAHPGHEPFAFLQTGFHEGSPRISPDGRWLAYSSDAGNATQVYVQSFPDKQATWQISVSGGSLPLWSRDGTELFYLAADGMLMAADVKSGAKFEHGIPKPLFPLGRTISAGARAFDISPDGKRFLVIRPPEQSATQRLTIVTNWLAGVKK